METEVLVVGAGPVGLTAAVELARRGVACRVVEERLLPRDSTRGCTVYQRTLEVFDAMGLPVREYVSAGTRLEQRVYHLFGERIGEVAMDEPASPHPFPLVISQHITERHLERRLRDLGVTVERGVAAGGVSQDGDGVTVELRHADGRRSTARAGWLVAAQGAAGGVRESLGVSWGEWRRFNGLEMLQIDARLRLPIPVRPGEAHMFFGAGGHVGCVPFPDGRYRVFAVRRRADGGDRSDPQPPEIVAALRELCGVGEIDLYDGRFGWRVRLQNRIASRFRVGRCFLAGDSARVFAPVHAQGMNTGIQDAFNLGWKLAAVARGEAPAALLDTYEAERRPVALELLERTERSLDFAVQDAPGREPLLELIARNRGKRTQLGIRYEASPLTRDLLGAEEGPRAGVRAPDAALDGGPGRGAWRLLAVTGRTGDEHAAGDLVRTLTRGRERQLDGAVVRQDGPHPPRLYLIRPDGYIGFRGGLDHGPQADGYLREVFGGPGASGGAVPTGTD